MPDGHAVLSSMHLKQWLPGVKNLELIMHTLSKTCLHRLIDMLAPIIIIVIIIIRHLCLNGGTFQLNT